MVSIPVNPSLISSAAVYSASLSSIPLNLCKPPSDGLRAVPMQFVFSARTAWLVDLGNGNPPPLSQICALYVDATNCTHDVNIYFPDSGYQVRIELGGSRLIPVITGLKYPKFYVILDSSNLVSATDIVNVIAMNQFIPEFGSDGLKDVLSYGYGSLFTPQPAFTQSDAFSNLAGLVADLSQTQVFCQQFFITSIQIGGGFTITAAGNQAYMLLVGAVDAGGSFTTYRAYPFTVSSSAGKQAIEIARESGLNIISPINQQGIATRLIALGANNLATVQCWINFGGGILIP